LRVVIQVVALFQLWRRQRAIRRRHYAHRRRSVWMFAFIWMYRSRDSVVRFLHARVRRRLRREIQHLVIVSSVGQDSIDFLFWIADVVVV